LGFKLTHVCATLVIAENDPVKPPKKDYMMTELLKNKRAVITGAAKGNGRAIAEAMLQEGANVSLIGLTNAIEETVSDLQMKFPKSDISGHMADISDSRKIRQVVEGVLSVSGRIDILVNNAGIYPMVPFSEISEAIRDRVLDVNIKGTWNCTQCIIPGMLKQGYGKVINISSVTGPFVAAQGSTIYSITKAAINGFTRALAIELAGSGININTICPGYVDTPGIRSVAASFGENPDNFIDMLAKSVPAKRVASTVDIAHLAVFLASAKSDYIHGAEIVIDGGNIIQEEKSVSVTS
jgi:NAD(P)-dependent dehydrogenase (short-subunit alcohol dehydrogenase family)